MRKRSSYRPKPVILDPITYVKTNVTPMVNLKDQLMAFQLKNHLALEALRLGEATKEDIDTIMNAFNITEALARQKIGNDYKIEIRQAQDAIYTCAKRGVQRGYHFVMTGPEIKAINFGMELHDEQLHVSTVKDIDEAVEYINTRLASKQARPILEKA